MSATKQAVIKTHWGEYYDECQHQENGWAQIPMNILNEILGKIPMDTQEVEGLHTIIEIHHRPKSLRGIEDNNGWNRIDEVGLPKGYGFYKFLFEGTVIAKAFIPHINCEGIKKRYTHWKQIEVEKLPLH